MARKKKHPSEMTNEELARMVFPKKAVEQLKEIANKPQQRSKRSSQPKSNT